MTTRFVIVDDDISLRRIIGNIIAEHNLGTVVAQCGDGLEAERTIIEYRPDIVFVDLLLPGQDGVELIRHLKDKAITAAFVMISESSSQPLITEAYEQGIEFYIHKPINMLEIISVINRVKENRALKKAMTLISQATAKYAVPDEPNYLTGDSRQKSVYKIFSDLGILGEAGIKHINEMVNVVGASAGIFSTAYQLNNIYQQLGKNAGLDTKTVEQRVRRAITKALQNLANIGVEDYHNDRFQTYSTALFDFAEIRQEMAFIQGKSPYRGKINVKKFIEGLVFLASAQKLPPSS
jgi:two-component system response regulator YcbB